MMFAYIRTVGAASNWDTFQLGKDINCTGTHILQKVNNHRGREEEGMGWGLVLSPPDCIHLQDN